MKKNILLIITILLSASSLLYAQDTKNKLGMAISPAYTGKFDSKGLAITGEYSRLIIGNLCIDFNLSVFDFNNSKRNLALTYKDAGTNLSYKINLGKSNHILLGAGVFLRQTNFIYYNYSNLVSNEHRELFDVYQIMNEQYFAVGYSFSLGWEYKIRENISISSNFLLKNNLNNDITWAFSPAINYYF